MNYQKLFDHMFEAHGLTLTEGEMQDIVSIIIPVVNSDEPEGSKYYTPEWWLNKPDEFEAVVVKHENGGEWGKFAAETAFGRFAFDKKSWPWAELWVGQAVTVSPFKKAYMTVEIIRPQP